MNTRLQVEHPVTEMILGIDLVEWQLRIAGGEALSLTQDEVRGDGHAFEARLYAEDPRRGFLPASGKLRELAWPAGDARLRIDAGVATGDMGGVHYDALLAKLIASGSDRADALGRLHSALAACRIEGVTTNLAALLALSSDPQVQEGRVFTRLIDERGVSLLPQFESQQRRAALLAALALLGVVEDLRGLLGAQRRGGAARAARSGRWNVPCLALAPAQGALAS